MDLGGVEAPLPEHPGHLDRQEWNTRQDVVHHGTYRKDWDQGSAVHSSGNNPDTHSTVTGLSVPKGFLDTKGKPGTDWSSYGPKFDPEVEDPDEFTAKIGQGRIHSRRLEHELPRARDISFYSGPMVKMSDSQANLAHAAHGYESEGEYPSATVSDSVPSDVHEALRHDPEWVFNDGYDDEEGSHWTEKWPKAAQGQQELAAGRPIIYDNVVEGGVSAVVPRGAGRTYEQDFLDAPGRSPHAKALMEASLSQVGPLSTPIPQSPQIIGSQFRLADTNYMDEVDRGLEKAHPDVFPAHQIKQDREPVRSYPRPDVGDDPTANDPFKDL